MACAAGAGERLRSFCSTVIVFSVCRIESRAEQAPAGATERQRENWKPPSTSTLSSPAAEKLKTIQDHAGVSGWNCWRPSRWVHDPVAMSTIPTALWVCEMLPVSALRSVASVPTRLPPLRRAQSGKRKKRLQSTE